MTFHDFSFQVFDFSSIFHTEIITPVPARKISDLPCRRYYYVSMKNRTHLKDSAEIKEHLKLHYHSSNSCKEDLRSSLQEPVILYDHGVLNAQSFVMAVTIYD